MPLSAQAQDQYNPSKTLEDLMFLALDHGIDSIREGGPLIPFLISEQGGKRQLQRFVAEPYEKAVAETKKAALNLPHQTTMYAFAYDGFVTLKGKKYDAIIVQGAERDKGMAYLLAQRYTPAKNGNFLKTIGNPAFLGREDALFK